MSLIDLLSRKKEEELIKSKTKGLIYFSNTNKIFSFSTGEG
jgi:hypothetical protein